MMAKQLTMTMGACALAAGFLVIGPAAAESPGQRQPSNQQGMQAGQAGQQATQAGQQATQRDPRSGYVEMYQAIGTITALDQSAGRVTVKLANGEEVKLNLPSPALREFDKGDRVTVTSQIALAENPNRAAGDAPRSGTQHGSQGGGASR